MEAKRDSLFVQVFSIALVSIMLVGSVPIMSLAAEQEAGTSVIVEAGSSAEYSFPVTAIEQPASLVGGEIAAQSPVLPVPSAVMQDMYADSAVDQVAVPVPAVIGSPDDVKYPLATNLYYARASGSAWGLGSGAILSVEIAAEWSSSGLADDGAIVKYYDSSLSAYGATLTAVDSANYATDHTLYLDVTGDKAVWTWADVANIHPEITFAKIGGPDGGSVYVDALWVRIQYDAVQLEYNLPVSLGWNLLSFPQVVSNSNILSVLDDCGGDTVWESVKGYDGLLATPWQGYNTLIPPELCKLNNVNNMMGLWVKITNTGTDGTLKVSGTPPTTTAINLYSGWNLVGYPTLEPKLASVSLSGTGADMISVFKSTTPYIEDRMDLSTVTMQPGNGYWIHVPSDSVWNVGDVTPPTFGGLVSATDSITDGAVYLSWNPATDPSYPITYNIYMATTAGGQNFASPNYVTDQTSIEVGGLITDQPYYFVVRAQDSAGNEDANAVERSATPIIPDTTDPQIIATVPANSATGIAVGQSIIVTFSESINTASFAYSCAPNPGGWSTAWSTVTYTNDRVTLTHTNFAYGTSHTFTVTAANDLAGNALTAGAIPNPWSFTTLAAPDTTGPIVSGVSAAPNPIVQGNTLTLTASVSDATTGNSNAAAAEWSRGASAAAAGSGTAMSASDGNFNSPTEGVTASLSTAGWPIGTNTLWVRGRDAANNWGNAVSTAVTVNGADTVPPQVESNTPANGATGVLVSANIVVDFNEAMNQGNTQGAFSTVPSVAGAFSWNAGGDIMTFNPTANLAYSTLYTVTILVAATDLAGNTLDGDKDGVMEADNKDKWVFSFTTGAEPDTTGPYIITTTPANAATGVAITQSVIITFSESINTGTFAYSCTPNPGGWSATWSTATYTNDRVTLTHTNFVYSTGYTFTVSAAQDTSGNTLTSGPVPNPWSFTTQANPDATGPIVSSVTATPNPVSLGSMLTLTASVSDVTTGNNNVAQAEWSRGASAAAAGSGTAMGASDGTFNTPTEGVTASISTTGWPSGTNTLWVRGRDSVGNWGNAVSASVTVTVPDTIPPQVTTNTPANGATGIVITTNVVVDFNEPMNQGNTQGAFSTNPSVAGAFSWNAGGDIMTFNPTANLAYSTLYTVTILVAATDLAGNTLDGDKDGTMEGDNKDKWVFSFTTAAAPDTIRPYITTTTPASGATGVAVTQSVIITFSESINTGTFAYSSNPNPGGWSAAWSTVTFTNDRVTLTHTSFAAGTTYTLTVSAASDLAGNTLTSGPVPNPWSFATTAGSIHRYAVCVGINKYDYQNDLTYCVNDASECRANLLGAGYSVNLLTDGQATKVAMLAALNTMGTNEVAGDYTAFTYSGHGGTSGGKYFICPEDCYYITDMITDDEMDAIFDTYQSTHQLLFFDSCNSGGLSLGQSGRLHIMAAAANQYSWDGQSDIANGVWTYYFWEYGYRLGNAGSTVLETVFAYAKPLASAYVTTNYGYSMTPQISDGYTGSFYL